MTIDRNARVHALLSNHGVRFAEELGISVEENTPAPLFQMLVASLLFSAPISARNATMATRALLAAGLTTPRKMAAATWQERVDVITSHGYKRLDESGATMLGETAELLLERYGGDLRKLREEAGREVRREKELLMQLKGIGSVGADIFLREVQVAWDEVYPYADPKVLAAAAKLQLGEDATELAELVPKADYPRLVAALVRVDLQRAYRAIIEHAA